MITSSLLKTEGDHQNINFFYVANPMWWILIILIISLVDLALEWEWCSYGYLLPNAKTLVFAKIVVLCTAEVGFESTITLRREQNETGTHVHSLLSNFCSRQVLNQPRGRTRHSALKNWIDKWAELCGLEPLSRDLY